MMGLHCSILAPSQSAQWRTLSLPLRLPTCLLIRYPPSSPYLRSTQSHPFDIFFLYNWQVLPVSNDCFPPSLCLSLALSPSLFKPLLLSLSLFFMVFPAGSSHSPIYLITLCCIYDPSYRFFLLWMLTGYNTRIPHQACVAPVFYIAPFLFQQ